MKKNLLSVLVAIAVSMLAGMMTSCLSCTGDFQNPGVITEETPKYQTDYDGVLPGVSSSAENIIALQRQTMFSILGGGDYVWYETKFSFGDTLTVGTLDDVDLLEITSVFQIFNPNLCYTITTSVVKGTLIPAPTPGTWIEDFDLSTAEIALDIEDVLARLKEVNAVIPPATFIVLRKPVGPMPCNAQYVMGNPMQTLWVDAVTGDVTDWCPAFPRAAVDMPLGEWP